MKLRQFGALKVQHGILKNVKPMLVRLIKNSDTITRIIPGVINRVKGVGGGDEVFSRVTVPLARTGWRTIVYADGCAQELFVSTVLSRAGLEDALTLAGAKVRSANTDGLNIPAQEQAQQALHDNTNFPVTWSTQEKKEKKG